MSDDKRNEWRFPKTKDGYIINLGEPLYHIKKRWGYTSQDKPAEEWHQIETITATFFQIDLLAGPEMMVGDREQLLPPSELYMKYENVKSEFDKRHAKEEESV